MNMFIVIILLTALVTACSPAAKEPQERAQNIASMQASVASNGYQKPGASVRMVQQDTPTLNVGEVQILAFEFISPSTSGMSVINVRADRPLQAVSDSPYSFDLSREPMTLELEINPNEEGRFYLHFYVKLNGLGRAFSFPVQVGEEVPERTAAEQEKSATGDNKIKSMPALERVGAK